MTVNAIVQPTQYVGSGTASTYSFPFLITAASDLAVGFIVGGVYTLQAAGYTVSGINNAGGGQVTLSTPLPLNTTIDLRSNIPETQPTNFANLGAYLPEANTAAVDRCVRLIQDLYRKSYQFGIHGPDTESVSWPALPAPAARANLGLGFDSSGTLSLTAQLATALTQSIFNTFQLGSPPYAITAAETVAAVSIAQGQYAPGNVLRYGINTVPGTTDMSGAINAAIAQAGNAGADVYVPPGNYYISAALTGAYSNLKITVDGTISAGSNQISIFSFNGQSNIEIGGRGTLTYSNSGATAHLGGVLLQDCSYVMVKDLSFTQMQYCGVHGLGSSYCKVLNTTMSNFLGTIVDAAGVSFLSDSINDAIGNEVAGNVMYATGEHGVLIQDPYTLGHVPRQNSVHNNNIRNTTGYGVAVYVPSVAASFNATISGTTLTVVTVAGGALAVGQVVVNVATGTVYGNIAAGSGTSWTLDASTTVGTSTAMYGSAPQNTANEVNDNYIDGIQGTGQAGGPNLSSGNGIYVVGYGAGAIVLTGNRIYNCCIQTGNASQAPAGIGCGFVIGNSNAVVTGPTIEGNTIWGMTQGHGIQVTGCSGAVIGPNQVFLPSTNSGSGAGGSALIGHALSVVNSNSTSVSGGRYETLGSGSGYFAQANGQILADVTVAGGRYRSFGGATFRIDQVNAGSNTNHVVSGVRATNSGTTASSYALELAAVPGLRLSGGVFLTGGTIAIAVLSSTCTDALIDKAFYGGGTGALVSNSGTGLTIIAMGVAAPSAGTWLTGDQILSKSGSNVAWLCSAGGSPGTWVSH